MTSWCPLGRRRRPNVAGGLGAQAPKKILDFCKARNDFRQKFSQKKFRFCQPKKSHTKKKFFFFFFWKIKSCKHLITEVLLIRNVRQESAIEMVKLKTCAPTK